MLNHASGISDLIRHPSEPNLLASPAIVRARIAVSSCRDREEAPKSDSIGWFADCAP